MPQDVGTRGEAAPEIIFRHELADGNDQVNEWLRKFEFANGIKSIDLGEGAFSLHVRRMRRGHAVNFADTGFGMSQVLPLLVQGIYGRQESQIIAEQPEIHLNPRLQAKLAELFVAFAQKERAVLIETHSEHLLLRLRRLVAEGKIASSEIALYYVETEGGQSSVREVPIQPNGHIERQDWPRGFFDETLRDSMGLATAQVTKSTTPKAPKNADRHRH
jgi:predicted ATPase